MSVAIIQEEIVLLEWLRKEGENHVWKQWELNRDSILGHFPGDRP